MTFEVKYLSLFRCWVLCSVDSIFCVILLQRHHWLGIPFPIFFPVSEIAMEGERTERTVIKSACLPCQDCTHEWNTEFCAVKCVAQNESELGDSNFVSLLYRVMSAQLTVDRYTVLPCPGAGI